MIPSNHSRCAGQKVREEKGHGRKVYQEIWQDRPFYHTEQCGRRLQHAYEDIVRAPQGRADQVNCRRNDSIASPFIIGFLSILAGVLEG